MKSAYWAQIFYNKNIFWTYRYRQSHLQAICDQKRRWANVQPIQATWSKEAKQSPRTADNIHFHSLRRVRLSDLLDPRTVYRQDTPEQNVQSADPLAMNNSLFCFLYRCSLSQLTLRGSDFSFPMFCFSPALWVFPFPFFLYQSISAALGLNH